MTQSDGAPGGGGEIYLAPTIRVGDSLELTPEKFVFGGATLARLNGRVVFVWGAIPGEKVIAKVSKKHKGVIEAIAEKIITPSPSRIEPTEEHWLCCSPWSIINQATELSAKLDVASETFRRIGKQVAIPEFDIYDSPRQFGYRNKMEFSFTADKNGAPSLAFFNRGSHSLSALPGCVLADPKINQVGELVVAWVRAAGLTVRNLKSVIIRSNSAGDVIAGLFIKDEVALPKLPEFPDFLKGFTVFYSTFRSPASTPDKILLSYGKLELSEQVGNVSLLYGLFSFFQVNRPVFLEALKDIKQFVKPGSELVDYYAGVGTIGLTLAVHAKKVILVESNKEATGYAAQNIASNKITNAEVITGPAEKLLEHITVNTTVVVDPPRAGLDQKVVGKLLSAKPPRLVYLSCGIDTQARDLDLLAPGFKPIFSRVYNFFPRTPHLESLVVLDRV